MKTLINVSWTIIGIQVLGFILVVIDREYRSEDIFGIAIAVFYAVFTFRAQKDLKNKKETTIN